MAEYKGNCNCGSVKVAVKTKPELVLVCHCANCKRAGGAFSMNFLIEDDQWELDGQQALSEYLDSNTDSGRTVHRFFCKNCGSPVKSVSPAIPGKTFVKASLFDDIPTAKKEVYDHKALNWA
ncbi:hypothetical protein CPLU01_11831 [Colletotrichum plurivorum]|uniref:CENP-V/GFA domain-containing protein n=1 Tax=Colletotrichum plurivorum TaxID=2175906 RepID=A0A8H6N7X1_9PEZI|nr:hypothetical protein CPLU01_11831 [Colletotrichum plurivorum]